MTRVYGASDDLIEFDGDVYGEVNATLKPTGDNVHFSDGTVLNVRYGKMVEKNGDVEEIGGVWWIQVKTNGTLFDRIDECFDEDAKIYSDQAYFHDGLTGATVRGKKVR